MIVIIPINYQTPRDLNACLRSIFETPPDEDFIVHVGEVDPTTEDLMTHRAQKKIGDFKRTIFEHNVGYARASNHIAALYPHADTFLICNADVEFVPGIIQTLHDKLQANKDWGVIGPRQVDKRSRITHAGIIGSATQTTLRGWRQQDRGQFQDVEPVETIMGSAMWISGRAWRKLTRCDLYQEVAPNAEGALLPTPHYYEERWMCAHMHAHGYEVVYYGAATMIHQWHRSSPIGGPADKQMKVSRGYYQMACERHGIGFEPT